MSLRARFPVVGGSALWLAGACFGVALGVLFVVLAGRVGPASTRWGLYGILLVQLGAWQASVYRKKSTTASWPLALLLVNLGVFGVLDQGLLGPEIDLYFRYEQVALVLGLLAVLTFAFALIGVALDDSRSGGSVAGIAPADRGSALRGVGLAIVTGAALAGWRAFDVSLDYRELAVAGAVNVALVSGALDAARAAILER